MLRSRDRKQERSVSCAKNLVGNVSSCLLFPNSSSIRILTDLVIKTHVFFSQKFHVFYLFICIDDYIKILLHRFACLHKTTLLCKVKLHCWRVVLAMWYWIWGNVLLLTWTWTRSVMTLFFQVCIIAWYSMQIKYLNLALHHDLWDLNHFFYSLFSLLTGLPNCHPLGFVHLLIS